MENETQIKYQPLGVAVVVLSRDGKEVLLGKRKNSYKSGYYGLPGGRLEPLEKVEVSAGRELLEETGLKTENLEFLGVIRDLQVDQTFIHFTFLCKTYQGEPKVMEPKKCEGWEWFDLGNIPDMTLPGHKAAVDIYLRPEGPNLRDISSLEEKR
jgi:8-oxo-dGTP diphosphatase